ncbi:MAG: histidine ammonia-lyase [Candidatus Cloacimonadota bacterium]|nr:MAG: histidine ammonia-lyase [Candidatus Cloacimonadota bacterium]
MKKTLIIDGNSLTIEDAYKVMSGKITKVSISDEAIIKINISRSRVEKVLDSGEAIYGINTGFGSLANKRIENEDLDTLQANLIRSHCVGVGDFFEDDIVRAILLLRANALCKGFSGIRLEMIEQILFFLNNNILPLIPKTGSLGACGDLAPLAHMSICLMGEQKVKYKGEIRQTSEVLKSLNQKPSVLKAKEGLALINGTPVMTAIGVKCLHKANQLLKIAELAAAISLDALKGTIKPFTAQLHAIRPHKGQVFSASNLIKILKGSKILENHVDCEKVQDAYSLRCAPQVHGACWDTYFRVYETIEIELNSVTDNPIVLEDEIISGGNFHGEPISMVLSFLLIAMCELGSISERRQNRLVNHNLSNLPPFLVGNSGLNSGLMIAHYTSAACVSENKTISFPAVVDSIPTSADQEDHVSMGVTAAKNCLEVLNRLESILSIELLISLQGLEFNLKENRSSTVIMKIFDRVRKDVSFIENDRYLRDDIEAIRVLIENNELIDILEIELGEIIFED